jgi:hypothetical protein
MATTRRVGVPVTEAQEEELEVFLPMLQDNPELWDKVMIDMVGHVTHHAMRSTIGIECRAPTSMPQLLASAAAIGLRQLQRAAIDAAYSKGWSALDAAMQPSIAQIQARSSEALAELDALEQGASRTKRPDARDYLTDRGIALSTNGMVARSEGGLRRNPKYQPGRIPQATALAFG